jgi:hypothetical protein
VVAEPDYALALEEARRGFDSLEKHLADIRNRSQQIVGIGALAASIVGVWRRSDRTNSACWASSPSPCSR